MRPSRHGFPAPLNRNGTYSIVIVGPGKDGPLGVTTISATDARSNGAASAGRPRSEAAHQAILDATLALLAEVGFSALTVEGVAQRAGVGKATIYRRWPSKLPLVVEAFGELPAFEDVDTGNLKGDLETMLTEYLKSFLATPLATVYPSLAAERRHNPELGELLDPLLRNRRRPLDAALRRAVARGELAEGIDLELASDLIVGPVAVRLFFRGTTIKPDMVGPMVEMALEGIRRRAPAKGGR
jgi:AcrR family transcriptional regulator